MRRADRLFRLVQLLRTRRRAVTAAWLAERLEVSERTIYRDVADLQASGVPLEGEAGVGYVLRHFDLPPLMFTEEEIEALVLGARVVRSWGDPELAAAARDALHKVEAVLPPRLEQRLRESRLYALNWGGPGPEAPWLPSVREAIRTRHKLRLGYTDRHGQRSERILRPLGLYFTAPTWLLTTWCELRKDYRNFRLDRVEELELLDQTFEEEEGCSLQDFLSRVTKGASS